MRRLITAASALALATSPVLASETFHFSDPSGLAAEAEFTLLNPTTLEVRLKNTSTGGPLGFDSADQILTGISWDFGDVGINDGDPVITGGTVVIGPESNSINFSTGSYGPGTDVGGEWGFGNAGATNFLPNFISALAAGTTPFGGPNLDGPVHLDGPQGGLVADPPITSLGGLGAIQDEIIATLTISEPLENLDFLAANLVTVEFGSDAAFITVPEPGSLVLLAVGMIGSLLRRHR